MGSDIPPSRRRSSEAAPNASETVAAEGFDALTDAVKSAIIDRVLRDLRADRSLGFPESRYTRSDSGLYGKYEKAGPLEPSMLAEIAQQLDRLLVEERRRHPGPTP